MDCVMVSGVPSRNRRLMMSLAGTSSASASSRTVTPRETLMASSSLGVHAPGQRLLNLALLLSLGSLALALLLALLAATGGLARGLLDGSTSLLEHLPRLYSSASRAMRL